ncbi:hypothetical protein AB832_01655 [Flavobacteriaceae bacterium (ex Bugula neritina AB1)]|nr:hypothetical protein AB832_01655 [Flavobacteriaceae bacterium (ex Bugula neritina AB1)]
MSLNIIKKRADKYNFIKIAGNFYRNNDSDLIRRLNESDNDNEVYFGIENKDGVYTVLGEKYLLFSTKSGVEKSISNLKFLEEIKKIGLSKEQKYEFVKIDENNSIWIYNIQMLSIILSLIVFLTRTDGLGIKAKT